MTSMLMKQKIARYRQFISNKQTYTLDRLGNYECDAQATLPPRYPYFRQEILSYLSKLLFPTVRISERKNLIFFRLNLLICFFQPATLCRIKQRTKTEMCARSYSRKRCRRQNSRHSVKWYGKNSRENSSFIEL